MRDFSKNTKSTKSRRQRSRPGVYLYGKLMHIKHKFLHYETI